MSSPAQRAWRAAVLASCCAGVIAPADSAGAIPAPRGKGNAFIEYAGDLPAPAPSSTAPLAATGTHSGAASGGSERGRPTRRWGGMLLAQGIDTGTVKVVRAERRKSLWSHPLDPAQDAIASRSPVFEGGPAPRLSGLLLAQNMGAADASDTRFDRGEPPASAIAPAPTDAAATASAGWSGWRMPPLRWGASTKTDIRMSRSGSDPRRLQQIESANIKAASYIYQPWFAQVRGGLGLILSKEQRDTSANVSAEQPRGAKSNLVTGNGEVTLFPVSRFPFSAFFDRSDSRASGELTSADVSNKRFGMRQSYRPPDGGDSYTASFNRGMLESQAFGRDTVDALAASMNRSDGAQLFNLSGSHTGNTRSNTGERTAFSQINGRHSYRPKPELSVESLASVSSSYFRLQSAGALSDNRSGFAQVNTFATWRPEEDSPLYVNGGARMFRSMIANNASQTQSLSLAANLAATYALSRQTNIAANVSATQVLADSANSLLTTQTAYVTRTGDPVGIFGANYTWNTAANVSNQTGAVEGARHILGGQFGHNLARVFTLGDDSQASVGLGQSAAASFDSVAGRAQTLSHNANASWRVTSGAATNVYVGLLGADSRTSGINANQFQMINFQVNGQVQFSYNSSASANLTVQGVRQNRPGAPSAGMDFNSSGNLSFFRQHLFGVPRLRYSALYGINESQFKSRLQGDIDAPRERVNQSLEQRIDYYVGRIGLRMSMRLARVEGRPDALIYFSINRDFGAY